MPRYGNIDRSASSVIGVCVEKNRSVFVVGRRRRRRRVLAWHVAPVERDRSGEEGAFPPGTLILGGGHTIRE